MGRIGLFVDGRALDPESHGENVAVTDLTVTNSADTAPVRVAGEPARHFVFSIRPVFGPSTSSSRGGAAESHFKLALMTREFDLNRN